MQLKLEPEVEEFLSALKPGTRHVYTRALQTFSSFLGQGNGTISGFLSSVEEDMRQPRFKKTRVARKTLSAFIEHLQQKGYSPNTVNAYVGAVQALAQYYDVSLSTRYVNRPPAKAVSKKHPWTIEEIGKFVALMDNIQYKSIAACMVQSGLSISDLLGLTYGDIRSEFERGITPLCLDLSRKKTNVPFVTFLGEWSLSLLRQHLAGRKLEDDSKLFDVTARTAEKYFRKTAKKFLGKFKGRNPCNPHSFRAAFRTILSDRRIDHLIIEFWMGHRVPEQQIVYVSKSREGWRETYRTLAEFWLTPQQQEAKTK